MNGIQGSKRGTGRTTRMMEAAADLADAGRTVVVVFEGRRQADKWARALGTASAVQVMTVDRMRGPHPVDWIEDARRDRIDIFLDHYLIETRLGPALAMLAQFDAPPRPVVEMAG